MTDIPLRAVLSWRQELLSLIKVLFFQNLDSSDSMTDACCFISTFPLCRLAGPNVFRKSPLLSEPIFECSIEWLATSPPSLNVVEYEGRNPKQLNFDHEFDIFDPGCELNSMHDQSHLSIRGVLFFSSHSISKVWFKSGNANTDAEHNLSLSSSNACD